MSKHLNAAILLGASLSLQAQTSTAPSPTATQALATATVSGQNCPVELSARRTPEGGLVETAPSDRRRDQGLRLLFKPVTAHGIAQADLVVHGMVGAQVMPAGSAAQRQATEAFQVMPNPGADRYDTATVHLKRLTGVSYVEVTTLTFADGTQWHSSQTSTCRVSPNGFKLVASAGSPHSLR